MPSSKILYILSFKYAGLSDNAFGSTCALKFAIQKLLFSPLYPVITSSRLNHRYILSVGSSVLCQKGQGGKQQGFLLYPVPWHTERSACEEKVGVLVPASDVYSFLH